MKLPTFITAIILGLGLFLIAYFLYIAKPQLGGDIIEYFGVTESVLNHGGVSLTDQDKENLSTLLNPGYFNDPGYYIPGRDGSKYPVHFFFYSFLVIPVRVILRLFQLSEVQALPITNSSILIGSLWIIQKHYVQTRFKKAILFVTAFLSPLVSFIIWPGPDLYYLCLLLITIFAFYSRQYGLVALLMVIASWHSQPLMTIALAATVWYIFQETKIKKVTSKQQSDSVIQIQPRVLGAVLGLGFLALVPYLYNYWAFGVLTPWTILQDGWTKIYGFGLQNASLKKLLEQFFDLNIGLFWYAPMFFILGMWGAFKQGLRDRKTWIVAGLFLITAFFYQTNPAWHYGTAGYGPGRHGIFLLPFLTYFTIKVVQNNWRYWIPIGLLVVSQIAILTHNGWLEPDLTNTHRHNAVARFVLDRWPNLYNPTPEIFVDRTNQTDLKYPTSAIYTSNGQCKKAYILKTDKDQLAQICGSIPQEITGYFDNPWLKPSNEPRFIMTTEATLWPYPVACEDWFYPTQVQQYMCLRTKDEVMYYTGVWDESRINTLPDFPNPGIWKIAWGDPVTIKVPPGYIIQHYSIVGRYVDY